MKETIDLLGKIITNILTALYEPFGFSLLLSFLAMFFYLYKNQWLIKVEWKKTQHIFEARCFKDVQAAASRNPFDVAGAGILDEVIGCLVNKNGIHNVLSFRGWHSEWNGIL